ncbi:DUF2267 domain-containing protein [Nocardia higoensis]|uniref:DUF2267 domain-containing protein n=1 Tax=Nocardia higoensis TaxID=228599 RepID=UPI000592C19B|nr:DUF2267 domain-containing protein [Nocardia higoensis]
MSHAHDPFAPAVHTAHEWLRAVADGLGTTDLVFAHRSLRAWMHVVRDRLGVANSAHLTAQLPELLRGIYYEGWVPAHTPVRHGLKEFIDQFAATAEIDRDEVGPVAGAVTEALAERFSPGQMDRVFSVLPTHLYSILRGEPVSRTTEHLAPQPAALDQATLLQERVQALGDAVAALARGLEQLPIEAGDSDRTASAAQEAHRILLAEGLGVGAQKR